MGSYKRWVHFPLDNSLPLCYLSPMPIDIHGLQKRYENMGTLDLPSITESIKTFRASIQGRKKEFLKPFGLDDLDKFKDTPYAFVNAVDSALDSFAEKKEQATLYKKIYEDERCLITMPKGPEGAAAAGSLLKKDGDAVCPWCVALKYPDNEKMWLQYNVDVVFFVYAKENGIVSNAWCLVLTAEDCLHSLESKFSLSHIEDTKNNGNGNDSVILATHLGNLFKETGLNSETLCSIFRKTLNPRRGKIEEQCRNFKLEKAVRAENLDECKRLLDGGANVNTRYNGGYTPLLTAVQIYGPRFCKMLIGAGADVNAKNNDGWTALMLAAHYNSAEVCKLLLDAGADVNARNNGGSTPLITAALKGKTEVCELLLNAGADVDAQDDEGETALIAAAGHGKTMVCRLLLDAGTDVNTQKKNGKTALALAAFYGHSAVCRMLLDAGADVNTRDKTGATPLILAMVYGEIELCKLLLDAGADVNIREEDGFTALMRATRWRNAEFTKMLIDAGADVNAKNNDGETALFWSRKCANTEVCEVLINAGAKE